MHDWLCSLAKFSVDPEALRNWVPHTEGGTLVQNRYLVLTKATARQAPDDDSLKLGEMPEGLVVQCVEELTDALRQALAHARIPVFEKKHKA